MSDLSSRQCIPCRGGVPPLQGQEITNLLTELDGWEVVNQHHLEKTFSFDNFRALMGAVPHVARAVGRTEQVAAP